MRRVPFLEVLAGGGVYPRLTVDGRLHVLHDEDCPLHVGGLHPEARDYVRANRAAIVAELVAWAASGEPPAPACCPDGVPPQGAVRRLPTALDTEVQDALTLAVLRGAGCEAFLDGDEIVLRGPTEDVHGFLAAHAEALGRALLRERGAEDVGRFPPRPPAMKWRTYAELEDRHHEAIVRQFRAFRVASARLGAP